MHTSRPVLLNSCALATTAAEARFRIDYPLAGARGTRVVALDAETAPAVHSMAAHNWNNAHFYTLGDPVGDTLVREDGAQRRLGDELVNVDAVVLVAATDTGASAATTIGKASATRGIMTAGLVFTPGKTQGAALMALRPHARMVLVPANEEDLLQLLRAIRA